MCRLLGIIANKEVDLRFSLLEGPRTLRTMSEKNVDGWGLGWYESGEAEVKKEPIKATESREYEPTALTAKSRIFVGHVRKATNGDLCEQNCHPFKHDQWLFAHNGSIDRDALLSLLDSSHIAAIKGETDSEVYFHWILQNIKNLGSPEDGIKEALREARNYEKKGLNFILTDGSHLYAYREAASNINYYSLYYLFREPSRYGPASFQSREIQTLIESKTLNNEKAVLVCSEKLTEEDWKEIPRKALLVVTSDLRVRLEMMD